MSDVEDQAAALSAEEEEEEEDVDEPTLRLQDIGTFTAQGGEITMKMEPVKQKKKKKKKKKDDKKKDDCSCDDKVDCPDLSKDENLPDCDLDTILERYEALFAGKPNGIEELLYWQRCPLAHAEQEVLGFGRSELLKNDIFPKEDTLEKNIDKLITLVSANLVPGLKAEYTGKKDKRGCETIVIVQKHGNKKVQKKEKPKKEKTGETTCGQKVKGCCSFCLTCQPCKACLGTCKGLCTKDPDDLQFEKKTGFPHFWLTDEQIDQIAETLDEEDSNGFLEGPELKTLGIWMRYRLTDPQLDEMCEDLGAVGDTGVSFDKFGKWLNSKSPIALALRKSLFPQEVKIAKHLKKSPFVTNDQINLMVNWVMEDPLDKSGTIKFEKLDKIDSMEILTYCPRLEILREEIDEMLKSLGMVNKAGEQQRDTVSSIDFAGWMNGNDVLAWKLRSILPYVEPAKDDWYPWEPSKASASSCHGSQEWSKVNACCVQSCCAGLCCVLPRSKTPLIGACFNTCCWPCQAPCCIHHCKKRPLRPLQPPKTCGKIIGCDCWCWHATCTWYPRCFPTCLCCEQEEMDGSPATFFTRSMFFPTDKIDIYDGQMDSWTDTAEKLPEPESKPDMEREAEPALLPAP
jgi:hypothetical protein